MKKTINNHDFYEAKSRLGLLSVGDPDATGKLQVSDTFLVSVARKVDNKIKSKPKLKKNLIRLRSHARKAKHLATKVKHSLKQSSTKNMATKIETSKNIDISSIVRNVEFKKVTEPEVSIVIPAFNKAEYTAACLVSLASNLDPSSPSFEVILVDNASTDDTPKLATIKNLVMVHNKENLAFVGGCNSGLAKARGKYVVFLNNDTEVDLLWLKTLHDTITSDPKIGLVGSKIIYPNGVLQEAGGIIFQDANGLNYGKFDNSDSYLYNYVRDVDYCSGASIIIARNLINEFGGFDTLYHPAYYEDTDLSFKVRDKGLRVVYQPDSIIYHIEGGTAGTNTNAGFKKFQLINKDKFEKRWHDTLANKHYAEDEQYLARNRSGDKLALIIEEALPTPDKDSGSVRMLAMIKGLQSLGYKVTFWPNNLKNPQPYTHNLQQMGVEVVYGQIDFMQFARNYGNFYDLVLMSRPEVCARYVGICKNLFTNATLLYDTVDLHYLRLRRQAEIEKANAEQLLEQSKWYEVLEKGLMERVDAAIVVSEKEIQILRDENVNVKIVAVSNIHQIRDEAYDTQFDKRGDIVFVGNYAHLPNRDAIKWFVNDILPEIQVHNSDLKLHVVGANMPDEINKFLSGRNGVIVHGFINDDKLAALLTKSRVFIAPLRYGAGVKGKIGQSIEYGLPVVTTSIGAEGMYLIDNESCLEADDAKSFSQAVIRLYGDKKLWIKIQQNAKASLAANFSSKKAIEGLKNAL